MFMKRGYGATTMSAIATELGGSKSTLWNYYSSKEALFAAIIEHEVCRFRDELLETLDRSTGLPQTLRDFSASLLRKLGRPEILRLHRRIIGEAERFPHLGRLFYELAPKQVERRLATYLDEAMKRGELRHADPRMAAQQLTALLQSDFVFRLWNVRTDYRQDTIAEANAAVETFLRAYAQGCTADQPRPFAGSHLHKT
jgi:TetR/AcrR family transcriptional regulator, mexJK operon transcriptional repressor